MEPEGSFMHSHKPTITLAFLFVMLYGSI